MSDWKKYGMRVNSVPQLLHGWIVSFLFFLYPRALRIKSHQNLFIFWNGVGIFDFIYKFMKANSCLTRILIYVREKVRILSGEIEILEREGGAWMKTCEWYRVNARLLDIESLLDRTWKNFEKLDLSLKAWKRP